MRGYRLAVNGVRMATYMEEDTARRIAHWQKGLGHAVSLIEVRSEPEAE